MYEANIMPNASYSNDFYTVKSVDVNCHTFDDFVEHIKEELSQFDPEDEPFAIVVKYVEFPWYGEHPIIEITYTKNFGFVIEDLREN